MAKSVALSDLRTLVRYYSDTENDTTFASNTELNARINRAYAALYDKIVDTNEGYFVSSADTTTTSGTDYALPATFYRLLGVDLSGSDGEFYPVDRFNFAERHTRRNSDAGLSETLYSLHGAYVRLIPAPAAGRTLRIWYVPAYTTLSGDSDTIDGVNGWEEWIAMEAAIGILQKEESDITDLMTRQAQVWDRISSAVAKRDSASPSRVIDVDEVYGDDVLVRRRF